MKVLTICNHGNVRSAAFSKVLKDINGVYLPDAITGGHLAGPRRYETFPIGAHQMSKESIRFLAGWADKVIVLCEGPNTVKELRELIPSEKFIEINIGGDRWLDPFHPELQDIAVTKIREVLQ